MDIDADYQPDGEGLIVVPRETCANGHPVAARNTSPCPRCGKHTRLYYCADIHCDGEVTSRAHEAVCPPAPAAA